MVDVAATKHPRMFHDARTRNETRAAAEPESEAVVTHGRRKSPLPPPAVRLLRSRGFTASTPGQNETRLRPERPRHQSKSNEGTLKMGYGLVGLLVIILLVVMIFYFARRA